jgi:hypothetical protein
MELSLSIFEKNELVICQWIRLWLSFVSPLKGQFSFVHFKKNEIISKKTAHFTDMEAVMETDQAAVNLNDQCEPEPSVSTYHDMQPI